MSRFAIKNPYFIIVCCLVIAIVGTTVLVRMPVVRPSLQIGGIENGERKGQQHIIEIIS